MNTCLLSIISKELLHASKATSRILVPWYKSLTSSLSTLTDSSDVWFAAIICLVEKGRSFCTPGIKGNVFSSFFPSSHSSSKKLVQIKRSSNKAVDFLTRALVLFSTWEKSRTVPLSKEMVFSLPLLKKIVISLLVDTANSEIFHIEKQVSSNSKKEKKIPFTYCWSHRN